MQVGSNRRWWLAPSLVSWIAPVAWIPLVSWVPAGARPDDKVEVTVVVVDAESGDPLPYRICVENADGVVHFPEDRGPLARRARIQSDSDRELEVIDGARVWSLHADEPARLRLPREDGFVLRIQHGLEYQRRSQTLDLSDVAGERMQVLFELERLTDMQARGWMSADTHVHAMAPDEVRMAMAVEDVDYANLMLCDKDDTTWSVGLGPVHDAESPGRIVCISQETRDYQLGHLTLLGLERPIEPIRDYSGRNPRHARGPARPNEPLNWEIAARTRRQGGLAVHAHALLWPGHGLAACAGLGRLDAVEWLETDIVATTHTGREELEQDVFKNPSTNALWYRLLDCGLDLPLVGGTDKTGNAMVIGGSARTYARVPSWDHAGFLAGVSAGATFVTNGPLLFLEADGRPVGSTIERAPGAAPAVKLRVECRSWSPVEVVEIIKDGRVVERVAVVGDPDHGWVAEAELNVPFRRSGWVAARARATEPDPESWQERIPAAHTSAIRVQVEGRPGNAAASASFFVRRLEVSERWAQSEGKWSTDASKARALEGFRQAREFFDRIAKGR